MTASSMEELVSLCKRRGFIFQSNDIYGGIKGLYDYGPMGVELKNNLKQAWLKSMVYERDDIGFRCFYIKRTCCIATIRS